MAIPKKSGLRKIKVGTTEYYWNFKTDYSTQTIRVRIGKVDDQNTNLLIEACYIDKWLTIRESETKKNEIEIVKPGFIRQAIEFALRHNWNKEERKRRILNYENNEFRIKE